MISLMFIEAREVLKMRWFKKTYLTWHEYAARKREAELLDFISSTTQKAIENYWKKEVGK